MNSNKIYKFNFLPQIFQGIFVKIILIFCNLSAMGLNIIIQRNLEEDKTHEHLNKIKII